MATRLPCSRAWRAVHPPRGSRPRHAPDRRHRLWPLQHRLAPYLFVSPSSCSSASSCSTRWPAASSSASTRPAAALRGVRRAGQLPLPPRATSCSGCACLNTRRLHGPVPVASDPAVAGAGAAAQQPARAVPQLLPLRVLLVAPGRQRVRRGHLPAAAGAAAGLVNKTIGAAPVHRQRDQLARQPRAGAPGRRDRGAVAVGRLRDGLLPGRAAVGRPRAVRGGAEVDGAGRGRSSGTSRCPASARCWCS